MLLYMLKIMRLRPTTLFGSQMVTISALSSDGLLAPRLVWKVIKLMDLFSLSKASLALTCFLLLLYQPSLSPPPPKDSVCKVVAKRALDNCISSPLPSRTANHLLGSSLPMPWYHPAFEERNWLSSFLQLPTLQIHLRPLHEFPEILLPNDHDHCGKESSL